MDWPAGVGKAGSPGVRVAARGPGAHDWNDPSRIGQVLSPGVSANQVEELDRPEVHLFVERVHGRHDLVVHAQPVVGLAHLQLHHERAEERRVDVAAPRVPLVAVHDVVVDRRQRARLVPIPEPLRVRDDALVRQRVHLCAATRHGSDPARGDPNLLVVAEAIEVRAQHPLGIERFFQQRSSVRRQRANPVRGTGIHHLEAHLFRLQSQVPGQHLVDGKDFVKPAEGRVNGLLGPLDGRFVPQEFDHDVVQLPVRDGVREPRANRFAQPREPLLERGQDLDPRGFRVGPRFQQPSTCFPGDCPTDLRRLRQASLDSHRRAGRRHALDALLEDGPEPVHLRRRLEDVLEDGRRRLHVPVVYGHDQAVRANCRRPLVHKRRVRTARCAVGRGVAVRLLQRHHHFRPSDPFVRQRGCDPVQLVEPDRGLASRRPPR